MSQTRNDAEESASTSQVILRDKASKAAGRDDDAIETEHKVSSLEDVSLGDHVVLLVSEKYCHALVSLVDSHDSCVEIIYYDEQNQTQCSLDDMLILQETQAADEAACKRVGVKQSRIAVDFKRVDIYVVEYAPKECLTPEETVEKASKLWNLR